MENQQTPLYPQSMAPPLPPPKLPGFGELLKKTWEIYKARLGTFLGIMIWPILIGLVLLLSFNWLKISFFILLFLILIILSAIVWFWSQVSLLYAIKERELKIGIKESFKKGWPKIIPFVWISFLTGFITMGGFLLFIVPGIILAVWFIFSTYILVSEDLRGMTALFRSKQLVKGNWGGVAWRILLLVLIIGLISIAIATIPTFVVSLINPLIGDIFSNIISSIINLFTTPFFITFAFLIYENLKNQKEGVPFEPPKRKTKVGYILIGIGGILLILLILVGIVMVSLKTPRDRFSVARVISDMSQIRSTAEIIFVDEESYSNVSCFHPGIAYLCEGIEGEIGEKPVIHSSPGNYCGFVELSSGNYYCIDSSLRASETSVFPGQRGFCDGITFVCPTK